MTSSQTVVVSALAAAGAYAAFRVVAFVRRKSPLDDLPGPSNPSWFLGHVLALNKENDSELQEEWVEKYGPVLRFHTLFGVRMKRDRQQVQKH
jgi:hypothetical protein